MQPLDDLLPQLLVDDVDQPAALDHQVVQLEQVQHGLGHDRQSVNRRPCNKRTAFVTHTAKIIILK